MSFFQATSLIALTLIAWHVVALFRAKTTTHQFHAVFLLILAIPLLHNYAQLSGYVIWPIATALCRSLLLVYGPMLYLFLRHIVKRPAKYWQWHFAPYILIACYKALSGGDYPPLLLVGVFFMHIAFYSIQTLQLLKAHNRVLTILLRRFAGASQHWLMWQTFGIAFLAFMDVAIIAWLSLGGQVNPWVWQCVMLCLSIYVLSIAALTAWQPGIFDPPQEPTTSSPSPYSAPSPKPRQLELAPSTAIALGEKLNAHLLEQQAYRQNDLSLDTLAATLGLSRQQMSELLNAHLKTGFYELINEYRINDAKAALTTSQAAVLDIAFAVGFNSKNAFYRAFKAATGKTPGDFRKHARHNQQAPPTELKNAVF
ncbi:helix-turn-helix domain-containing protein [Marinagarivorans cellulosilyticus]|uniref:Two-component system, sensor histidine kinase LadS n=1 Tax=Marinagarivorans cellulosilyticus TaxID=2721545 RepID=A0AAN1WKQ3_9GAMM|nr:AraC family transcriptional regulator [Marinagarivorans cellulosilyticus]BCD99365.1 two-component system, sensor histidine kinase LadS [Marinagarivorans cellulosilyticus]